MFAIFSKETALPPTGLLGFEQAYVAEQNFNANCFQDLDRDARKSSELKRQCSATLGKINGRHQESQSVDLGSGNGLNFFVGPFCHYSTKDGVSCLFSGVVAARPGLDLMAENHNAYVAGFPEDAHDESSWLLTFYNTFHAASSTGITEEALHSLEKLDGSFAFVIYDRQHRRVLAARDRCGLQPLFWGSTLDGRLMFATDLLDLADCSPSATAFPAGSLFLSESKAKAKQPGELGWTIDDHVVPGDLRSFVPRSVPVQCAEFRCIKAVPRITSQGCLRGAVYRVASENNVVDWGQSY